MPLVTSRTDSPLRRVCDDIHIALVSVDELIVGGRLGFPVHDAAGVLLLAAGATITEEIKRGLKRRASGKLQVAIEDVPAVTSRGPAARTASTQPEESALLERIDRLVREAMNSMQTGGRSVRNEIVFRGCSPYDGRQRQRLVELHSQNTRHIGNLASRALAGEECHAGIIADMAAEYLRELKADPANTVTSAAAFSTDSVLERHAIEVSLVAMALGIELDLDADNVRLLGIAGLVHDFGMVRVAPAIRNAPRKLQNRELAEIRRHPRYSFELLSRMKHLPREVPAVAFQVHERFNGSGYPLGRTGGEILLPARIVQVADAFVAMSSRRPHRPALTRYRAMERMVRLAGERQFDPEVVRALLRVQALFPLGSFVRLSDGTQARVLRSNADAYATPIVQLDPHEFPEGQFPNGESTIVDLKNAPIRIAQALRTPGSDEREQDT